MNLLLKLKIMLTALLGVVILERRRRLTNDLKGFANNYKMKAFRYFKILILLAAAAIIIFHFLPEIEIL